MFLLEGNLWDLSLTNGCPLVDWVRGVAFERRVELLPEDVDFVLQVDEEDICVACWSPRVAAHAPVAVVAVEDLLLRPRVVAVGPTHRVESGAIHTVPEMDTDGLIGTGACRRRLPRDGGVLVGGVAVESTVPASLEPNVRVVHRLQVQRIDWSWPPDVGGIIVNDFGDSIVVADIEYMPLPPCQSQAYFKAGLKTYTSCLISGIGHSGYWSSIFGVVGDHLSDVAPLPLAIC